MSTSQCKSMQRNCTTGTVIVYHRHIQGTGLMSVVIEYKVLENIMFKWVANNYYEPNDWDYHMVHLVGGNH